MDTLMAIKLKGDDRAGLINNIILILIISIAVFYDFKTWKIPNPLILAGVLTGILTSIYTKGFARGIKDSVIGVIIPVVILFIFFLFRFLGAGDIKLLSVVGAFTGISILKIILYAFISGGIISIIYLIEKYILSVANRNNISVVKLKCKSETGIGKLKNGKIHFSLAVLAGLVYYMTTVP